MSIQACACEFLLVVAAINLGHVILSAAKHLISPGTEILRCAQDDILGFDREKPLSRAVTRIRRSHGICWSRKDDGIGNCLVLTDGSNDRDLLIIG